MALESRLKRWTEAGLIEPQQAQRILDFEQGRERPMLLYAVAGLGGLAIAIGVVSIVAANWDVIPGRVKIGIDFVLLLAGGIALVKNRHTWPPWLREAALLILYGLTLGSIALVGQVYQLGGSARAALLSWSCLTAPLMALGHSGLVAFVWVIGLEATTGVWMAWLADRPLDESGWALAGTSLVPWVLLLLGSSSWLRRVRSHYAGTFTAIAWAELVIGASIGVNAFYEDARREPWNALWVGFAIATGLLALFWRRHRAVLIDTGAIWLLVACLLCTYIPARVSPGGWDILAALSFIGLWLVVALAAHRARLAGLVNLATGVVGVRILVVYFEVFGSLLDTGLGLVIGGALTLLLVWLWWRARRGLQEGRSP